MWNQISTPDFAYQNDQRNKIYTLGDFEKKTPTHMVATHAISKSQQNFQNRIPRELDKNFYIPRISMIYWISSNFLKLKNRPQKKVISIPNPGIQPMYRSKYTWKSKTFPWPDKSLNSVLVLILQYIDHRLNILVLHSL